MSGSKIVIVGDVGVGKSALVKRLTYDMFEPNYKATIGVNAVTSCSGITLYDVAGQELYGNLTSLYYKDAMGAFVMMDYTRLLTCETAKRWKKDLDNKLPNKPVLLLINKMDLVEHSEPFDYDTFCEENGFKRWYLISVKNASHTSRLIEDMIEFCKDCKVDVKIIEKETSLYDELKSNSKETVERRESYVKQHYDQLQSYVVDQLKKYSLTRLYNQYEFNIGDIIILII